MTRSTIFRLVVGALAVVALAMLAQLFERVEETEDRGYSGEAAVHPFYALKEMFAGLGIPTRTLGSLRGLPPTDHVLWIAAPSRGSDHRRLVSWAENGGHLVVVPAGEWGADPLLQALGVQRFGEDEADDDDHLSRPRLASERSPWPKLFFHEGTEVVWSDGAADAAWTLTVGVGDGFATVLADGAFLHNQAIGRLDHALIAWDAGVGAAAGFDREPVGIWIVYRDPPPSIWVLMTARARPLAVALAVLVLAAMLYSTRRCGPLLESAPRDRRQLAEHVSASGDFLWNVGCEDALLRAEREALGRRLGRGMQPSSQELGVLARRAAATAGLDESTVYKALALGETRDRQKFTRTIRILETLRRSS